MALSRGTTKNMSNVTDKYTMKISKQLEKLLSDNAINVSQLARDVGISSKTIHNWTTGQKPRDIDQVKLVADYFGISIDELCFGSSKKINKVNFEEHQSEINAGVYEVILRKVKKN